MNAIIIQKSSPRDSSPQQAVLTLDDILSFDSNQKQPPPFPKDNESQNITRDALHNLITTRRKIRVPSRESKANKNSQDVLESARTTNPRSTPRMNVYLNNYDYYEQRISQNLPPSTPQQSQTARSKELDLSRASNLVQRNLSNFGDVSAEEFDLQAEIDRLEPYDKLKLPAQTIKVEQLRIEKPLKLIGQSNTRIEVSHSIHINLSKFPKKHKKVLFSECSIDFEYQNKKNLSSQLLSTKRIERSGVFRFDERKSMSDTMGFNQSNLFSGGLGTAEIQRGTGGVSQNLSDLREYPLFTIYSNSCLELSDCNITSRNSDLTNGYDICFYLKKALEDQFDDFDTQPSLIVQSTIAQEFTKVIQNTTLGKIIIEKMYISDTKGHALDISNPLLLEAKDCVFDRSGKSCINIRFSKEISSLSSLDRKVLVENCELSKGKGYGISIFGENMIFHHCVLQIIGNKIRCFAKDGIGIKNLNIKEILLQKNEITENQRSGIFLTNILDTLNFSQVQLIENKLIESQLYGLAILSTGCFSENNEISQNLKGGVLLSSGDRGNEVEDIEYFKKHPLRNIFNTDNICQNRDSGVVIIGPLKGPLIFKSCRIYGNTNGFYIRQVAENAPNKPGERAISSKGEVVGDILLDKCSVFENLVNGVHIKSLLNQFFLKETTVYQNKNYAAFIQREEDKDKLVFKGEGKKNKPKFYIFGYVGGPWGYLFDQNQNNACKGAKCTIF